MTNNYIELKIGKMRKPQNFLVQTVCELGGGQQIVIQSSKSIGRLDTATGEFRFTTKGCYFPHLTFAEPLELPEEVKAKITEIAFGGKN